MLVPLPRGHARQYVLLIAPLFALSFFMPVSPGATEQNDLAVLLRQINQLDDQVNGMVRDPEHEHPRYHFDHPRLREDLQRIRQGVRDYLSPRRAQPRDPAPLSGDYRQETEVSP